MKKKWLVWIVVLLLVLAAVGFILRKRYGTTLFYKNVFNDAENHVSFAYPEKRTMMTGGNNPYLVATITAPEISEYTPSFNLTRENISTGMNLETYVSQTINQLKEVIGGFEEDSNSSGNVGGYESKKILFHGSYLGKSFQWEQVYTLNE